MSTPFNTSASALMLGKNVFDRNDEYWDGKIDDLRIYDRVLSAAEIQSLATNTAPTFSPPGSPNTLDGAPTCTVSEHRRCTRC